MYSVLFRAPKSRLIPKVGQWMRSGNVPVRTLYALSVGTTTIPYSNLFSKQNKEFLEEREIHCPVHCYIQPIHDQLNELKKEVRPRSIFQLFVVAIQKVNSIFHLTLRAIQIMVVFSPAILTSWVLFIPKWRKWWYRLLVNTLQVGGSTFMKLGQWAATRPDILPINLCMELSTLHSTVACLDYPIMHEVIDRELGRNAEDVFETIDETPIGSGCIAQVYKAKIRGSDDCVAIKVKRPGVDVQFRRDLLLLRWIARCASYLPCMEYINPVEMVRLFNNAMEQQLDFRVEAVNLVHFNENFKDDDQFVFPQPYLNLTTPSLLVESFEEGVPLSQLLSQPSEFNSTIAHLGVLGFLHMLLIDNFLHADLHPGNILVRNSVECKIPYTHSVSHSYVTKATHPQLVFLDSGLVSIFEDSQKQNFIDLFIALAHGDGYEAGKLLIERAPQPSPPVIDPEGFMIEIRDLLNDNMDDGVFNLSKLEVANALTRMMTSSLTHHVSIDSRFVNMFMSAIILEGVGRQLDEKLNIISACLPIIMYSIPQCGGVAVSAMKDSSFARKSAWVTLKAMIKDKLHLAKDDATEQDSKIDETSENVYEERASYALKIFDSVEKEQK